MSIDLRLGDTIEQMKLIADKTIDFICCDLPYGMTAPKWDCWGNEVESDLIFK